jgi:flavin reductase (DIM6/NTAB) family NADH-FMN oxidoreductase RutF/DNA-binding IclR family transcriptional regulator
MPAFQSSELRNALGAFVTGVTVITTRDEHGKAHGVTANSFNSVSLDPPLILWSQSLNSKSLPAFRDGERFVVNILADDQVHISNRFATSGDDKFNGIPYTEGMGGVPIIDGSAAHLECTKVATYPGGDHVVYLGRVEKIFRAPRKSLAFGEGKYMVTFAHDLGGVVSQCEGIAGLAQIEAIRTATAALPDISAQLGQRTIGLAVWGNHGPTIIRWEPSRDPVSEYLQSGTVVSITKSATGCAFAAFLPRTFTQAYIDAALLEDAQGQPHAECVAAYESKLEEVRRHGMARAVGRNPSARHQVMVNAFSVPVFDAMGDLIMVLATTCRAETLAPDWDGPVPTALLRAGQALSRLFGFKGDVSGDAGTGTA